MKIFKNIFIDKIYKRSALAIGNFDGVHKGHQKVFDLAKKHAKKNKIKFGILTFTPLPVMFFNKSIKNFRVVSENKKMELFKKYGADFVRQQSGFTRFMDAVYNRHDFDAHNPLNWLGELSNGIGSGIEKLDLEILVLVLEM